MILCYTFNIKTAVLVLIDSGIPGFCFAYKLLFGFCNHLCALQHEL